MTSTRWRLAAFAVALLVLATSAQALQWGSDLFQKRDWSETQALTRAAPTLATEGMPLATVITFLVVAEADSGQTLTSGKIDFYLWDDVLGGWFIQPDKTWTLPAACSGKRRCASPVQVDFQPRGRVLAAANGVVVSLGGFTARIEAIVSGRSTGT